MPKRRRGSCEKVRALYDQNRRENERKLAVDESGGNGIGSTGINGRPAAWRGKERI